MKENKETKEGKKERDNQVLQETKDYERMKEHILERPTLVIYRPAPPCEVAKKERLCECVFIAVASVNATIYPVLKVPEYDLMPLCIPNGEAGGNEYGHTHNTPTSAKNARQF